MKKLFVFLAFLFGSACADTLPVSTNAFDVKLENLELNQVLNNTKKYISSEFFQAPDNEIDEARALGLALVNKELELFKEIIEGFNKGFLLFVECKFLTLCNHFKNLNSVEPRHIRAFKTKLDKFDKFMQKYYAERQNYMAPEEVALCGKICEFNMILSSSLMKYEYFGITWADRILDWTVFRPYELACAHPVITAIVISLIIILIAYCIYRKYYAHKKYTQKHGPKIIDGVPVVEKKSKVDQAASNNAGTGNAWCGAYALENASDTPVDKTNLAKKLATSQAYLDACRADLGAAQTEKDHLTAKLAKLKVPQIGPLRKNDVTPVETLRKDISEQDKTIGDYSRNVAIIEECRVGNWKHVTNLLSWMESTEMRCLMESEQNEGKLLDTFIVPDVALLDQLAVEDGLKKNLDAMQNQLAEDGVLGRKIKGGEAFGASDGDIDGQVWTDVILPEFDRVVGQDNLLEVLRKNLTSEDTKKQIRDILSANAMGPNSSFVITDKDGKKISLADKLVDLKNNGTPIKFVVNVGTSVDVDGTLCGGRRAHWIETEATSDEVSYTDSMGRDFSDSEVIKKICKIFRPYMRIGKTKQNP